MQALCGLLFQKQFRINPGAIQSDRPVQMSARHAPGRAHFTDLLTLLYQLARGDIDLAQVGVESL